MAMSKDELRDVGTWKNKAITSKGGFVNHALSETAKKNYDNIKKSCGCPFGKKCDCVR